MDHVGRVLLKWKAREPKLDMSPVAAAARILRAADHLKRTIEGALTKHNLSFGDFDVINAIRREGTESGLNPKLLASYALITSGAMTARIDRLEERGFIVRRPDPQDRRAVLIQLTPQGEKLACNALRSLIEADRHFLSPLSKTETLEMATQLCKLLLPYERF